MNTFIQQFQQMESLRAWLTQLDSATNQLVLGLSGSAKHFAQAAAFEQTQKTTVIVVATDLQATQTYEELLEWYTEEHVYLFAGEETLAAEMAYPSPEITAQRIAALDFLSSEKSGFVIISLAGLRKRLLPLEKWRQYTKTLTIGMEIATLEQFVEDLVTMGYRREQLVAAPGEFSVRGGIIDVYPLQEEHPIRLDFFDVELDSIRTFDAETQRSLDVLSSITILPASELPIAKQTLLSHTNAFKKYSAKSLKAIEGEAHQLLQAQSSHMIEQLEQGEIPSQLYWWIQAIDSELTSVLSYVRKDALLLIDDLARLNERDLLLDKEDAEWVTHKAIRGELLPNMRLRNSARELIKFAPQAKTVFSLLQKGLGRVPFDAVHTVMYRSMTQFFSQMPLFKVESDRWKKQKNTVVVFVEDEMRAKKLEQTFHDFAIEALVTSKQNMIPQQLQIIVGSVQTGFELPSDHFVVLSEKELFNKVTKRAPRPQKISNAERLKSYTELAVGDFVVHVHHGIGKYLGMKTLEINGIHQDYMSIEYQDGGNLFVPITQIKLVQKYVSSDAKVPKLNKLGGSEWAKSKRKVAAKIEDIADELIELYAKRDTEQGYAFSKDSPEQQQFEDAFPYSETDDQLRSAKEIKADMEKIKPMDRLLVGDVGYGKTEVAMRAAFKALNDAKQVAVLVPTTVLAEQHYKNFTQRFADYPFTIGLLSRFRTKKEQEKTVEGLKKGQVDIVIGTHRLLSKDVQFLDLGLLIVDEEQRFGVRHKERLKQLKSQVDVLTLTATPIPRTLHMSMLGVRDLSVIETPPANRYPVQTYVIEHDGLTIRDAIEREMARGGQIYYVYNRVETIERKADEIRQLVPGVRVAVAHGQMSETALEDVLYQFIEGLFDVLVTTTIIETGIDIPNVNTLLVENADQMGLSQLYQLRGRVGRTNRLAYAYLMYQPSRSLSEVSEKRLKAMRDFTELGSGFKIAMRDLSIRGAGNLLGKQQHGFIDSVGFDLYSQMLSEAVAKKQGRNVQTAQEETVEIDLAIDAYLPDYYIQDERQKIEIYKRIRTLETTELYEELLDDLLDRFGPFPDEVADLVEIGMMKTYAENVGITLIRRVNQTVTVVFNEQSSQKLSGVDIFTALKETVLPAQVNMKNKKLHVLLAIAGMPQDRWLRELKQFLAGCVQVLQKIEE